ncbi:LuxR C-terminal-related transcriptional regulator [Streptomyces pimonensis]|uniref:LuxR C-terminal-related transcriptional regulator n=1 Tax=Streptomyces pimonensis TaxID=2860288 RepID=A0ABV4J7J0_9ACTN
MSASGSSGRSSKERRGTRRRTSGVPHVSSAAEERGRYSELLRTIESSLPPLVCREDELAIATECLADPQQNCLVVEGDSGVGKSRLGLEVLRLAARQGHPTARAVATVASAAIPLATLAHLLPENVVLQDPVALFRATAAELRPLPAARRLVLMVDDLHLIDGTSMSLLRQLLDADVIFLIALVRTNDADSRNSAALQADSTHTSWMHLEPFSEEAVAQYLRVVLDGPVSGTAVAGFHRLSNGNALLLRELLVGALKAGSLHRVSSIWQLEEHAVSSPTLARMISRRLDVLGPAEHSLVETLACCEPLDIEALESGVPKADLGRLESEGIVRVRHSGQRHMCSLAHPLYGEVIRRRIPRVRQRAIYREQANWLKRRGRRRRDDAMRIATFELAADGTTSTPTLLSAARLARHGRDHEKVIELLEAIPQAEADFSVASMRGEAYYQIGDFSEAEEALGRAYELAPDVEQFLSVVMLRTQNAFYGQCSLTRALEINSEAVRDERFPAAGPVLKIIEAAIRLYSDTTGDVLEMLRDVERIPVPPVRHWALLQRSLALSFRGRSDEAVKCARRAHAEHQEYIREEKHQDHPTHDSLPAAWVTLAYVEGGLFDDARAVAGAAYDYALKTCSRQPQSLHACQLGRCELVAGNLKAARAWYLEAVASAHGLRQPMIHEQAWAGLMAVHAQLGETEQALFAAARYEETMAERPTRGVEVAMSVAAVGRAWLQFALGEPERAVGELDEAIERLRAKQQYANEGWLLIEKVRLGGADEASARLDELARRHPGSLMRVRSEIASAVVARNGEDLMGSVESCSGIGLHLLAAETSLAASQAFTARGDKKRAARALQVSEWHCHRSGGARTPGLTRWPGAAPLTRREREVSLLAAKGMTSRQIAAHLVLSARTVENVLQRVYNKTGVSSRRELTEALSTVVSGHLEENPDTDGVRKPARRSLR